MKKIPLIFAAGFFAAAAGAQPQTGLIAQIHFAGGDRISADPGHFAFTNEFSSPEAKALESQTLDRLSRVPAAWFQSKIPAGAGDGAAQLRPLLDDLMASEWNFEMCDAPGSPEYALAIRLNPDRAQLWSKNLAAVLQSWTGISIVPDKSGNWELKKHEPPDLFQFRGEGDWVVIDCGQDGLSLGAGTIPGAAAAQGWLSASADWPRLAQLFPALKEFDFPKIQMQVAGHGTNLEISGKLTLAQPLPPLEKWRLPVSTMHQPLLSFTAVRGAGSWLARQPWMQPLLIQPQPEQLFIWAMAGIPSQTFAAEPVPEATAALAQLDRQLSANPGWQRQFTYKTFSVMTNNTISLRGLPPLIEPFVRAVREPGGDFLYGGCFPNTGRPTPPPPELLARLDAPNLVYYHWEVTAERLRELPQFSQLMLALTRRQEVDMQSVAGKWLARVRPTPGTSNTEVTQTAPNELAFQRTAPCGLNAIELFALADWLQAPKFPAFDLRLPPLRIRPVIRPAPKPVAVPPVRPPVFPPPHP